MSVTPGSWPKGFLARKSENLKPQSVEHLRRTLHVMFAFALRAELLRGDNPVSKVPRRVIPENEIRFMEPENVATLIAAVPTRWRNLFAAAVYLGARKGELLALRVRSVDLQRRCVTLARSHDGATKSGKVRVVAIPDELVPFLEDALARTKSEFLFPGPNGKRRSPHVRLEVILRRALVKAKVIDSWRHLCRRPGCGEVVEAEDATARRCPKCDFALWPVPVPPHLNFKDLRSTWATTAYEATGDVRFVQAGLGHSDPRLTEQRYAAARARRMLEQANKVRFGAVPPVSYPVLTGAPETPNPPLLSEATGSMNPKAYEQWACRDSNAGPLASEANGRTLSVPLAGGGS